MIMGATDNEDSDYNRADPRRNDGDIDDQGYTMFGLLEKRQREAFSLTKRGKNWLKLEVGATIGVVGVTLVSPGINGVMALGVWTLLLPVAYAFAEKKE